MVASTDVDNWLFGYSDLLECRDVIRWASMHILLLCIQPGCSLALSSIARFVKIKNGSRICCRTCFGPTDTATYRCAFVFNQYVDIIVWNNSSGVLADNCTSRFGRRRPYMMIATIICVFAMVLLGFTRWFVSIFVSGEDNSVRYQIFHIHYWADCLALEWPFDNLAGGICYLFHWLCC